MSISHDWVRSKLGSDEYELSNHAEDERQNEMISIADIENVLYSGKIIEQYSIGGSRKNESCLIAGTGVSGDPVHVVVCKTNTDELRVITVYLPKPPQFIDPYRRSK